MSNFFVDLKKLSGISFFEDIIEKARKGEQVGGDYIWREPIPEKVSNKGGKQTVTRYRYYYMKDLLRDSADAILSKIGKFFLKGNEKATKDLDKAYTDLNIKKDFDADKKTFFQHVVEYFAHRDIWDKRFANKNAREKFKKPVKMNVADKVTPKDMETPKPDNDQPELFTDIEIKKAEWKANPYLMRKIWGMYTGKAVAEQEKKNEIVEQRVEKQEDKNLKAAKEKLANANKRLEKNPDNPLANADKVDAENYINSVGNNDNNTDKKYKDAKDIFDIDYEMARYNYTHKGLKITEPDGTESIIHLDNDVNDAKYSYKFFTAHKTDWSKYDINETLKDLVADHQGEISDFDKETISNYAKEKAVQDVLREFINGTLKVEPEESEQEKHDNRSAAMQGNQNAKKYGPEYEDIKQKFINASEDKGVLINPSELKKLLNKNKKHLKEISTALMWVRNEEQFKQYSELENKQSQKVEAIQVVDDWLKAKIKNKTQLSLRDYYAEHENNGTTTEAELTPEQENVIRNGFKKFMNSMEIKTIAEQSQKGEEKQFFKDKIKEIANNLIDLKNRWYNSYDEKLGKHKAGVHLFDANSDFYITEWDGENEAFGYTILNGDTEMAEWGYIDLPGLIDAHKSPFNQLEMDLYYDNSGYVEDDPKVSPAIEVTSIEEESNENYDRVAIDELARDFRNDDKIYTLFNGLNAKYTLDNKGRIYDLLKNRVEEILNTPSDNPLSGIDTKYAAHSEKNVTDIVDQMLKNEIEESEAEKHNNRSQALIGNQNARKYGLTDDVYDLIMKKMDVLYDGEDPSLFPTSDLVEQLNNYEEGTENKSAIRELEAVAARMNIDIAGLLNNLYKEYINGGNNNESDNIETGRNGLSGNNGQIYTGSSERNSNKNGDETEIADNRKDTLHGISEPGIGSGESGSNDGGSGNGFSTGRLTKGKAKAIREECRKILQKPDSEITEADKAVLAQYEGAGGLHEGDQSDAAVLSEFYTPRDVIKKVWQLVDKYNPNKNKKVIEPSSGIGRFAEGRTEDFTLCELDETSARIAKLLHPDANVKQGAFQKLFVKNNSVQKEYKGEKYDVAVGNPPYGDYTGMYKGLGEGKIHTRYEEYFIDRTLDTLKDGGIMAFVVPSGFLRNANSKAKEAIAKKGKLLEAWRLPKGTFSSTDVGTDIIVLRKEPGNIEDFNNNKYFEDNDSHVIGYETNTGNWGSAVVNLPEGKTVDEAIQMIDVNAVEVDQKIAEISENIKVEVTPPANVTRNYAWNDEIETPEGKGRVTGFVKEKGKIKAYVTNVNGKRVEVPAETSAEEHENRSRAMIGNDNAKKLVHAETTKKAKKGDEYTQSVGHNMTADEFSKKFGKDIPEQDLKFWKKTNWEGVVEKSDLTANEISELDKNKNFIKDYNGNYVNVVNFASGNIYQKLEDLEAKLRLSEISQEEYQNKKALLEAAKPAKKTAEQFTVSPLSNFSRTFNFENGQNLVDRFLFDYCGFSKTGSAWDINLSDHELDDNVRWEDVWDYIHQKAVITERARWDEDKETNKMIANQRKQARRETAERLFNDFIRKLPKDEIEAVENAWNKQFNSIVNPDFKKIPLFVEGLNTHKGNHEFDPTEQQIKGISELCNKGNGILAYDVGVGKTFCGIVATVNQLETGKAKKPLIMVPKSVYKKWIKEIHQHFPNLQVNELGNFSEKDIGKYKGSDGKYNFPEGALNVCTYEALQKVTFKDETLNGDLRDDMLDSQSIYDYDENGNLVADTRSEVEKAKANEKIMKLLGKSAAAKDGAVFWEDLGIDHLTVDELHNFKNIFSIPRTLGKSVRQTSEKKYDIWGRKVSGDDEGKLANEFQGLNGASSSRGMKMFAISQLIQRENNGKGFFGLSATPFNNSPVEIYNILSLVARNRLKELKIFNLQDFLREFAELKPDFKVNAKGEAVEAQTMKNFKNLGALQNLITEFIDKVDGEEAGVVRPRKQLHMPELDLTPLQKQIMEVEKMRMDGQFSKGKDNSGDVLVAMNNMRMAVLSPALIDPKFYADYESVYDDFEPPSPKDVVEESPKLQFVCDSVAKQYKERPTEGQVIYMPRGVGKKAGKGDDDVSYGDKVNGFQAMKDYLVSQGMPADSIAFMNSDTSLDQKELIKEDFNNPDGKIKVIIGSETIKEGVSLNGNSTTLYNTMLGWNPTETIQVEGRIWRQGNKQGITHIVYPLMNDSIDAMMYQKYDEKSSRLNALWSYKGDSLNVEDYNPEEVKYELIKDPEKRANMKIMFEQKDLKKQLRMENARYDNLYDTQDQYKNLNSHIENYQKQLPEYERDVEQKQAAVEAAKNDLEKAKKTLTTAKKAKDDDLIEMANSKVESATKALDRAKTNLDYSKSDLRMQNKNIKELNDKKAGIEAYWQKNGVKDPSKISEKLTEISNKRADLEDKLDNIKNQKDEFVREAKKQLEAESAKQKHFTVQQVVDNTVSSISENLRPMDAKLKAEIRAELEEKYPHLKKSILFVNNGRIYMRHYIKKC